jgi:hypothetical protein
MIVSGSRHSEGRAFQPEESAFFMRSLQSTSRFLGPKSAALGMTGMGAKEPSPGVVLVSFDTTTPGVRELLSSKQTCYASTVR